MRILFVTQSPPASTAGGVEVYTMFLAQTLSAMGHDVSFFTRENRPDAQEFEVRNYTEDGMKITAVNRFMDKAQPFEDHYLCREVETRFETLISETKPDIVHIHHLGGLSYNIVEALQSQSIPFVQTIHDFSLFCPRGQLLDEDAGICHPVEIKKCAKCLKPHTQHTSSLFMKLYNYIFMSEKGYWQMREYRERSMRLLQAAAAVLTPGDFVRQKAIELGCENPETHAMPYGYDLKLFDKLRQDKSSGQARKFVFAGSLIPAKGVHILADAFKLACRRSEHDLSLKVIGPCPDYHGKKGYGDKLKRSMRGLNVEFLGELAHGELLQCLTGEDVLIMPSLWWETHGIVLREARLLGLAAIVSGHGALSEGASEVGGTLVFKPGDHKDLAGKIILLAEKKELYQELTSHECKVKTIEQDASDHLQIYGKFANPAG